MFVNRSTRPLTAAVSTLAVAAALALGFAAPSPGDSPPAHYVVRPGDTLWRIAEQRYSGDPREAVYRIEQANGLAGAMVRVGQRLVLP